MQKVNTLKLSDPNYPEILSHIHDPPAQLYCKGVDLGHWLNTPKVAIVGSRKVTGYGRQVTKQLAGELVQAGVVIISGLAFGVDSIAHESALASGGITIAVLPTSVEEIYPASHAGLARRIVDSGGSLISEYAKGTAGFKEHFIARNRIVSGLADVLLITEAARNSGSLHTARFALEQGKTVMVVPGNITSLMSEGCNNLIKSGAIPVTAAGDVLFALGIKADTEIRRTFRGTPQEEQVLRLVEDGISSQEELALAAQMDGAGLSSVLTMLEVAGAIRPEGAGRWIRL